jgi:dTDP-4-amino-4,6-dideoxygalactose transaminase
MDWKVKYIDYPQHFKKMESEVMDTIHTVLSRGDLMLRQQLRDFEINFAKFVGTQYAVGVSNCTDGLHLSLIAAGVGAGDEVITVSHTFVATAEAIVHTEATPVFVDIGDDHNMNVDLLEKVITPRTKAIIPVHLNGRVCQMEQLMMIAKEHNLIVIEDSAQALGASFKGVKGGALGLTGCFSFYPAKLLGAFGDAGAVVTNDEKIAEKIRLLRDHGRGKNNEIELWGFNCRLDNLHAALLDIKLKKVLQWIFRRREIASIYDHGLSRIKEIQLPPAPADNGLFFDVFQNYEIEAESQSELRNYLTHQGIETMVPWGGKGVHQFKALGLSRFKLPRTEELFKKALMLPMHPELTDEHVNYVIDSIRTFYENNKA